MEGFWRLVVVLILVGVVDAAFGRQAATVLLILLFAVWLAMLALRMAARSADRHERGRTHRGR